MVHATVHHFDPKTIQSKRTAMFIYHFNRLIRNRLLWLFFAGLMIFAFVVVDSCAPSSDPKRPEGTLAGENVYEDDFGAATKIAELNYSYQSDVDFATIRNAAWELLAAAHTAEKYDLLPSGNATGEIIVNRFTDRTTGVFNRMQYNYILDQWGFTSTENLEKLAIVVGLPELLVPSPASHLVAMSTGWASPMEVQTDLSALYDKTTVRIATLKNPLAGQELNLPKEDVEAYYTSNLDDYLQPELRTISYIALPLDAYKEGIEILKDDAMQYYDDFQDTYTKPSEKEGEEDIITPFEDVEKEITDKLIAEKALEKAAEYAIEKLILSVIDNGLDAAAKALNLEVIEKKGFSISDPLVNIQNRNDFIMNVFEMDMESTSYTCVTGTDVVYVIGLTQIEEERTRTYEEVEMIARISAEREEMAERFENIGKDAVLTLNAALAKDGTTFDQAVTAAAIEGLTVSEPRVFTVRSDEAPVEFPHRSQAVSASFGLPEKTISEPVILNDSELILVYLDVRETANQIAKDMASGERRQQLARNKAYQISEDWKKWNLEEGIGFTDSNYGAPLSFEASDE